MLSGTRSLVLGGVAVALVACAKPEPTFPGFSEAKGPIASLECAVLQQTFARLLVTHPQGNVVLSPHQLVLGLFEAGVRGDERQRFQILRFLGYRGDWPRLADELARVSRVSVGGTSADDQTRAIRFEYEAIVTGLGHAQTTESSVESLHSAFNQRELEQARRERPLAHLISLMDAQVAGVPMLTEPLFHPAKVAFGDHDSVAGVQMSGGAWYGVSPDYKNAFWAAENDGPDTVPARMEGRAVVAFSLPTSADLTAADRLPVLPCHGAGLPPGGAKVSLDFRAPTFCAYQKTALSSLAPELASQLATDVELRTRFAFDQRGTINLPERAVRSPSVLDQGAGRRTQHALHLDRPFFVTVHDRISGAILYVTYVREPTSLSDCQ
jgi:hypothetical protein